MNNSDNKYCFWMITIQESEGGQLPPEDEIVKILQEMSERYMFQREKGSLEHYQGCFKSKIRKRYRTVLAEWLEAIKQFPGLPDSAVQIEPMNGTWAQALAYCSKKETKVGETYTNEVTYSGKDIAILDEKEKRFFGSRVSLISYLMRMRLVLKTPMIARSFGFGTPKEVLVKASWLSTCAFVMIVLLKFLSERQTNYDRH